MRDEMDSRLWVEHHSDFSDSVSRGLGALLLSFCNLQAIQFAAPWRDRSTNGC